jgi:hypothetical protein
MKSDMRLQVRHTALHLKENLPMTFAHQTGWNRMPATRAAVAAGLLSLCGCVLAQSNPGWQFGAVLDITHTSQALALGSRDKGLQLGHSDLSAAGPLGPWFKAQVGAVVATHEGKLEKGIEEAWIETTRLPGGLQARAGRFASQVGYLNQQHPHADDFVERPLLYRGFLGGHWNDDGLRLNWTAPTPFYLMVGAEAFRGKRLVEEVAGPARRMGATTFVVKTGADLNRSHSWQLGLSHIRNTREALIEAHEEGAEEGAHEHGDEHAHEHGHGAAFSGRRTAMVDFIWKWAPGGNNRDQQVRVGLEVARISGLGAAFASTDKHQASALSVVWRFRPDWEVGARWDRLRVRMAHDGEVHGGQLNEQALMLAWKPSHMQSLRLQVTSQRDAVEFENPARRAWQLQYVLAFGAHGAHAF